MIVSTNWLHVSFFYLVLGRAGGTRLSGHHGEGQGGSGRAEQRHRKQSLRQDTQSHCRSHSHEKFIS